MLNSLVLHLLHVVCRSDGLPVKPEPILYFGSHRCSVVSLYLQSSFMPHIQGRRTEEFCRGLRSEGIHLVQAQGDGYLLRFLDDAWRQSPDHQWFCQSIHQQFCFNARVCRYLRRTACQYIDFSVANQRNLLHLAHPILHETLRHQERDAHSHVCMGAEVRTLCSWQSRQRCVDVHTVHDRLWRGLRLLQYQRFALCG